MYPVIFSWSGYPVITWTVMAMIGCWWAYFSFVYDLKNKKIPERQVQVFFLGCILVWFVGAYWGQTFTVGRDSSLPFRMAGLVLYGGVFATILYGFLFWWFSSWRRKVSVQELWDFGAMALAWAMFFGRVGCTLYGCCFGKPSGDWPGYELSREHWDFQNRPYPEELHGVRLHPATLYEAIGILGLIGFLYWIRKIEKIKPGRFTPGVPGWIYWVCYGMLRFWLEFIRLDDRGPLTLGFSPSQCFALVTLFLGAVMIPWERRRYGKSR